MTNRLKIYLGDLTYDTIAISTEALPINIGYIASYCIKRFKTDVDITLFKYFTDLEKAIHDSPPDIMGLSNYCWSQNVSTEMFRMLKERNPYALTVWGGPNFPIDMPSQKKFLDERPEVDICVPIDGEIGFSNVVEQALKINSKEEIREKVLEKPIEGCISRGPDGKLQYTFSDVRIKNLDEIPSPYLTGLLDRFFDGKLIPMLQTNRGCPFHCTFCTDGKDEVNQVNKFSKERVRAEVFYIAERIPEITHSMFISDLNFGMIPGDLDTCNAIMETQKKYNYPHKIISTTGKNNKERIIESIKRLNGSTVLYMSVQSMDEEVLKNIRRDNISVENMMSLAPVIKEYDLLTMAEVILGLPGESYENHLDTLRKLVLAQMDDIIVHTCMLLPGSEMATPEQRRKWKFQSKFRILPLDFATLTNGKRVCEIEEVVIASKDLTFDEYVKLRMIGFTMWMTNKGILYDPLFKFLREQNMDVFELFHQMIERIDKAPSSVREILDHFKRSIIDELWDSPEELLAKVQEDEFYQELLDDEGAVNAYRHYHAQVLSECMDDWTEYAVQISYDLLSENGKINEEVEQQFRTVSDYCRGSCHNPLGRDRMSTNPTFEFQFDITKWLADKTNSLKLSQCKLDSPYKAIFRLTDEQFKVIQDTLDMFADNLAGRSKALKMASQQMLWRIPALPISYTRNRKKQDSRTDNTRDYTGLC